MSSLVSVALAGRGAGPLRVAAQAVARDRLRLERWRDLQAALVVTVVAAAVFWFVPVVPG